MKNLYALFSYVNHITVENKYFTSEASVDEHA
jgi:hypothetical protein